MACSSLCVLLSSILLKSYKSPYNKRRNIKDAIKESQLNKDVNKHACVCGLQCACKEKMIRNNYKRNIYIPIKTLLPNVGTIDITDQSDNYHYGEVELECLCPDSPACRCCYNVETVHSSSDENF
eukprot:UN08814